MAADAEGQADRGASALPRRLATIVAIDAAGYSRQSEIDEATAIREITALGERIRASAESRGGRVFNTAGDGFMLEFPSATAAVAAAEEVQAVDRVPLRIGIHLGEVHETPTRDLLGKGVNVAARLMQLAQAGSIVISGDAKRALSADTSARLRRGGHVRLDKMSERIDTFVLGSAWHRPRAVPLPWALAGGAAAAVLVAAVFAVPAWLRPDSHAVAVLEFRALDPTLTSFSAGLADRIISTMSENDLQPAHSTATADADRISEAAKTGAPFVLDGTARPEGDELLVTARLLDMRGNLAIWTNEYRRTASEQNYMQEQIASDVARVLQCALITLRPHAGEIDPQTLGVFLRACDRLGNPSANPEETLAIVRQVTERAPRFSRGWSMRARLAAERTAWSLPPEQTEAFTAEARDGAARARRLDPSNGESYLAEMFLLPTRDWGGQQALIDQALAVEPDLAAAHAAQAFLLMEVGRTREALAPMQRAAAIEPLNPEFWSSMTPPLMSNGRFTEAAALRERQYRVWPDSVAAWINRFFNSVFVGDPAEGLQMLDNMATAPFQFEPDVAALWRAMLVARQSGNPARVRAAALGLRQLIPGRFSRDGVGAALAYAGEIDAAIEVMTPIVGHPNYRTHTFWHPPWRNLRRDPRFMDLIKDMELIPYWRETGRWPDFCAEADLPYDCQAEAARVLPL